MYTVVPLASVPCVAGPPLTSVNDCVAWKQTQKALESPGVSGAFGLRTTPSATGKLSEDVIVPVGALNVLLSLRMLGGVQEPVTAIDRVCTCGGVGHVRVGRHEEVTALAGRRPHRRGDRLRGGGARGSRAGRPGQEVTESATTTLLPVTAVVEPPTSAMLKETGFGSAPFGSFTVFAV